MWHEHWSEELKFSIKIGTFVKTENSKASGKIFLKNQWLEMDL